MPWIKKSDVIGGVLMLVGLGILTGHWLAHREWHTPSLVAAGTFILLGALLLDPEKVKAALGSFGSFLGSLKDVVPIGRSKSTGGEK
jgi:uncharacterized membrane protein YkgB